MDFADWVQNEIVWNNFYTTRLQFLLISSKYNLLWTDGWAFYAALADSRYETDIAVLHNNCSERRKNFLLIHQYLLLLTGILSHCILDTFRYRSAFALSYRMVHPSTYTLEYKEKYVQGGSSSKILRVNACDTAALDRR